MEDQAAVDPKKLAEIRDLQIEGDPDLLFELIDLFLQDAPRRITALDAAVQEGDSRARARAAHALKGSGGNLGAVRLAGYCAHLMREEIGNEEGAIILRQLKAEFKRVRAELDAERARILGRQR